MALLNDLIGFIDQQPRTVAVALLAVLAVGGVGGGLWISNLNSAVEEMDSIWEQRLALAEERNTNATVVLHEEKLKLKKELEILKNATSDLGAKLDLVADRVEKMGEGKDLSDQSEPSLETVVATLREEASGIRRGLERAAELMSFAESMRRTRIGEKELSCSSPQWIAILMLLAVILVVFIILRYAARILWRLVARWKSGS